MKKTLLALGLVIMILSSFTFIKVVTYSVDVEKSSLTWVGKKVAYSHTGTIKISTGGLDISNNNLVGGTFTIDMKSIKDLDIEDDCKNTKLVGHLKSKDFFNVSEYPSATMVLTSAKMKKSDEANYEITGDLTIKGITHPVTFPANVEVGDHVVTAKATLIFDRSKYKIKYGSGSFFDDLGDKLIYDDIEIGIELIASR